MKSAINGTWRALGAVGLLLAGTGAAEGIDQTVRDKSGQEWTVSINAGSSRMAQGRGGASRSVPEPRTAEEAQLFLPEPAAPSSTAADLPSDPPPPSAPVLPTPPMPGAAVRDTGHGILIVPAKVAADAARTNGKTYREVYDSIPFSYTEYLANPGYRHEAAMEILFGQMRPTTVHKEYTPQVVPDPTPSLYQPFLFAHPEQWIYRYTDYRYNWFLSPEYYAPYGKFRW